MEMDAIVSSDELIDHGNKDREVKLPVSKPWVKGLINRRYQRVYRKIETLRNLRSRMDSVVASTLRPFNQIGLKARRGI